MSNEEKMALQQLRIETLENNHQEMRTDVKDIKETLYRLDKKLSTVPDSGFQCQVHAMKIDNYEKRLTAVEGTIASMAKKVIVGYSIASVVIFLLTQLAFPYVVQHIKVVSVDEPTSKVSQTVKTNIPPNNTSLATTVIH